MIGVCFQCGTIVRMPKLRTEHCPICPNKQSYDTLVRITEKERDKIVELPTAERAAYAWSRRNLR